MNRDEKEALVLELGRFIAERTAELQKRVDGLVVKVAALEMRTMQLEAKAAPHKLKVVGDK